MRGLASAGNHRACDCADFTDTYLDLAPTTP